MYGNKRRILILVGLIVIAVVMVLGALLLKRRPQSTTQAETQEPQTVDIIIAANNLPRGMVIADEHIMPQPWPIDQLPPAYYTSREDVLGYTVRADVIPQGMPLMPSMLAQGPVAVEGTGSEAALTIPPGKRAYAIPMDLLGAVAWTIQPGDHVDILASWSIFSLDEEFQAPLPDQYVCIGGDTPCQGIYGRMEILPTGQTIMVYPAASNQHQYVAQITIQNALVLGVGEFEIPQPAIESTRPAAEATPERSTPLEGQQAAGQESAPPPPPSAQAVILVVDTQDALVLKALTELQANIDLALRASGDSNIANVTPVTIDYIMTRYGITQPPSLPYGVTAPEAHPLEREIESSVGNANRPGE